MKKLSIIIILLASAAAVWAEDHTIQQYLSIRSARSPSMSPDGSRFAYLTNVSGTWQVWATPLEASKAKQLTNFDDNVSFVRWLDDDSGIIFGKAKGGNENTQFFWMKTDGSDVRALTDEPNVRHNFGLVTDEGKFIAYASNKRDRNYFDIYLMEIATGKEALLYQNNGYNSVQAMDVGGKLIVSRDATELSLDNNLYLIDPRAKTELLLTPHKGAAQFDDAHFTADGIVFTHNNEREFIGLAQLRQKNAAGDDWSAANLEMSLIDDAEWDVGNIVMPAYGNKMAYTVNREGFSELYIRKYETGGKPLITTIDKTAVMVKLPDKGIVAGISFDRDQDKLAFAFSSPTRNAEIFVYDLKKDKLTQYTWSDLAGLSRGDFIEPRLIKYKTFDGLELSAWFYEPARKRSFSLAMGDKPPTAPAVSKPTVPVIVSVHGGPEGQERPGFNPLYQYYASRGYAILAPNVRGSTGYGKTFTHLDAVKKREDSVKDLAFAVKWLTGEGAADPKRIAIMGGSYGGYMTLAAITLYPDLWAAAVDTVGIANWESFLRNTSGYRQRQREVEYGRLDKDLKFLKAISPLAKVDKIKCPLFVIHGKNDPRVPYTEAEQIVAALKKRNVTVQYKLYDDEGHGISKLKNRLELYPLVADFLDTNMKK